MVRDCQYFQAQMPNCGSKVRILGAVKDKDLTLLNSSLMIENLIGRESAQG
jgi:hypothetical protein